MYTRLRCYERILVKLSFPTQPISEVSLTRLWRVSCVDANMLVVIKRRLKLELIFSLEAFVSPGT